MIPNHHLEALGWTLIHFCWQAAVIALTYKIVDIFSSKRATARPIASQTRYLFALTAMLGMFAAAAGTFLYEEFRLQHSSTSIYATDSSTNQTQPSDFALSTDTKAEDTPSTPTFRDNLAAALPDTATLLPWLDALWMLGVLILSVRTVGGWILIQRLRSTAIHQVPPQLAISFRRISRRMGVHGRVALRLSTRIASPLAVGMFRSLILLPASALTTLSPEQLEAVLAHELAHIRRADYLWNILQTMIETLFFFHPAVWWVGSSLRQQRELCCDDIAIACSDPVIYATALLLLEEQRAQSLSLHTPTAEFPLALALDGHQPRFTLRSRIARILGDQEGESLPPTISPKNIAPFSIVGVCGALALFLLPLPQVLASLRPVPMQTAPVPIAALPETPAAPQSETTRSRAHMVPVAVVHPPNQPVPSPAPPAPAPTTPHNVTVIAPIAAADLIAPRAAVAVLAQPAPLAAPAPKAHPMPRVVIAGNYNFNLDANHDVDWIQVSKAIAMAQAAAGVSSGTASAPKSSYIEDMRAAGYDGDIDYFIAMKVQGITPEFARSMAQIGFGKPTQKELLALKIHGITPEYVAQLKAAGLKPEKFEDVVSYRIFNVSPDYIAGMKAAGFGDIPPRKLIELRAQNITPDFARSAKAAFPDITLSELTQLRIFSIDDTFINAAKKHGLTPLTVSKLVKLRISGLIDDEAPASVAREKDREAREKEREAASEARDKQREKEQEARELQREKEQDARDRQRDAQDKIKDKQKDKKKDKVVKQ